MLHMSQLLHPLANACKQLSCGATLRKACSRLQVVHQAQEVPCKIITQSVSVLSVIMTSVTTNSHRHVHAASDDPTSHDTTKAKATKT